MKGCLFIILLLLLGCQGKENDKGLECLLNDDYDCAYKEFYPRAKNGDDVARYHIGEMFSLGLLGEQDHAKAMKWFKLSAEQGNEKAIQRSAEGYEFGHGVKQDKDKALELYHEVDHLPIVQFILGFKYLTGDLVGHRDYKKALEWLLKSTEGDTGYNIPEQYIGRIYLEGGDGVEQDFHKAAKWFQKAIDLGATDVKNELAQLYLQGLGVKQNKSKAIELYKESCNDRGHNGINFIEGCEKYRALTEQN